MAFSSRVTSRYAKSILGLADEKGILEAIKEDMAGIVSLCEQNMDIVLFLNSPIIAGETKEAILGKIFKGKVNDLTLTFMSILAKKGRENALFEIAKEFLAQYNLKMGIQKATVYSAIELDAKLKASFEDVVAKSLNKKVELTEEVKEDLLGGYILRVDDQQIDASLKSKLQQIKNSIN